MRTGQPLSRSDFPSDPAALGEAVLVGVAACLQVVAIPLVAILPATWTLANMATVGLCVFVIYSGHVRRRGR